MSDRPPGVLVLIVGPSGVGKDTLIGGARKALEQDRRFSFVRRRVTRPADIDLEDHVGMDRQEFARADTAGRFTLVWQAHGLDYALPISVDTDLALGRVVIANISRHAVPAAIAKFPHCRVVQISAEISLRAERLARRGRESRDQIAARLAREGAALPADITPLIIDNSGTPANGVTTFVMALRRIAQE